MTVDQGAQMIALLTDLRDRLDTLLQFLSDTGVVLIGACLVAVVYMGYRAGRSLWGA